MNRRVLHVDTITEGDGNGRSAGQILVGNWELEGFKDDGKFVTLTIVRKK